MREGIKSYVYAAGGVVRWMFFAFVVIPLVVIAALVALAMVGWVIQEFLK